MPFLQPNQQRQSTEGTELYSGRKTVSCCCTRVKIVVHTRCRSNLRSLPSIAVKTASRWTFKLTQYTIINLQHEQKKGNDSQYSITECSVPELIPLNGSQPAGDVSHKPIGRLSLLSARPAVTLATLNRAASNFAAWWTEARWVWTICLRLLPDSIAAAIWTRPFCARATTHKHIHREAEKKKPIFFCVHLF